MSDGNPERPYATMVARAMKIMETLDNSRRGLNISEISRKLTISAVEMIELAEAARGD